MHRIDRDLKELFVALHTSGIWHDEKALSDAVLKHEPEEILAAYEAEKDASDFDLEQFFHAHFDFAEDAAVVFVAHSSRTPEEHINALWPYLHKRRDVAERSSKIPLPYSYVVPGGRFQEVYYWDSYFTQIGLLVSGKMPWVADLVANFDYLIQTLGHVPNGNRTYYESRSQPPFFALMVDGLAQASEDPDAIYAKHLDALKKELAFWSTPERTRGGLTRYYDRENGPRVEMFGTDLEWLSHAEQRPEFFRHLRAACESGWDFSSRWFEQGKGLESIETLNLCPVDLNCLLYFLEDLLGRITGEKEYMEAAQRRKLAVQEKMFDPEKGFFDWQWDEGQLRNEHPSAAMMYPLFLGVATEAQAEVVVAQMNIHLLQAGGITTTPVFSGQQWDAPNGWAPLQWVAFEGLRKYGYDKEAREVGERWLRTCEVVYKAQGKFVEKYNVYEPENLSAGGEYDLQDGFGWSNGVYLAMKAALK